MTPGSDLEKLEPALKPAAQQIGRMLDIDLISEPPHALPPNVCTQSVGICVARGAGSDSQLAGVSGCHIFVPAPHAPPPKGIGQRSKIVILPTTAPALSEEEKREQDEELERIADRFVNTLNAACSKKKKRRQFFFTVKFLKYIFVFSWERQLCPP